MAVGPGKYDDICTVARESAHAKGAIVIIVDGDKGSGFSTQAPLDVILRLPAVLRSMADQIEAGHG